MLHHLMALGQAGGVMLWLGHTGRHVPSTSEAPGAITELSPVSQTCSLCSAAPAPLRSRRPLLAKTSMLLNLQVVLV